MIRWCPQARRRKTTQVNEVSGNLIDLPLQTCCSMRGCGSAWTGFFWEVYLTFQYIGTPYSVCTVHCTGYGSTYIQYIPRTSYRKQKLDTCSFSSILVTCIASDVSFLIIQRVKWHAGSIIIRPLMVLQIHVNGRIILLPA